MKLYFSKDSIELDAQLTAQNLRRASGGSIQDPNHKAKDGPDWPIFWVWAGSRAEIENLPPDARPPMDSGAFTNALAAWKAGQ